jgi:aminoglycoside phosphotransferase (APT) family kinase protein
VSGELDEFRAAAAAHAARSAHLVDADVLGRWMDAEGLPGDGAPELAYIRGGSQNEIFSVKRGGEHFVLRRPPEVVPPGRNELMMREYRVLQALRGTDVPHAEAVAACDDHSVQGVSFYLMRFVDGWSPVGVDTWPAPFDTDQAARAELGAACIDGAARLSRVDWVAGGLEGFGKPDRFLDRQVDRWLSHFDKVRIRDLPGIDEAAAWLRTHIPAAQAPGIIHGDYQFANVMFGHGRPGRLAAIVDWEMATIGDPLLDLGWMLQGWPDDPTNHMHTFSAEGLAPRDDMLELYARVSGRDVSASDYYVVLARFKLAIVLEGGFAALHKGESTNERVLAYGETVLNLMRGAAELAAVSRLPATG